MLEEEIKFENYTIIKVLGEGGAGKVFLAKQENLNRYVAIKVINKTKTYSADLVQRGMREARILATLQHPNIVNIYDTGEKDTYFYMIIEYVELGSLEKEILRNSNIKENDVWQICLQLCQALQAALGEKIIHRDIKPENILLVKKNLAKISDFGISKSVEKNNTATITKEGVILGTPGYISPETAQNGTHDYRSDIYSLGVTLYYTLTGKPVFDGKNILQLLYKHVNDNVEAPIVRNPALSPDANLIIAKMLQKNPDLRYQSYADIIIDTECLLTRQSLKYANMDDAKRIYNSQDIIKFSRQTKRLTITRRIRKITEGLVTPTNVKNIIIVGTWKLESIEKYLTGQVNFMTTFEELKALFANNNFFPSKNIIVLDIDSLQEKTIELFTLLREKYPDVYIFFTVEDAGDALKSYDKYIASHEHLTRTIHNMNVFTKVSNLSFTLMMRIAKSQSWSFQLEVSEKDENIGSVSIENGAVSKLETTREITDIHELFVNKNTTWRMVKGSEHNDYGDV